MFFYAQLNPESIVVAVTQTSGVLFAPDVIALDSYDASVLGKRYNRETGEFDDVEQAAQYAAHVVITGIAADAEHAADSSISTDFRTVDTSVGAVLSFTAALQDDAGHVLPVDQTFRMPLVAADGSNDRRLIRVNFVQGVAQFDVPLTVSRHWRVDEATINLNLQPHERLAFAGLDVYVLE